MDGDLSQAVKLRNPPRNNREKRSIYSRYLKPNIFSFKNKTGDSADEAAGKVNKNYVVNDKMSSSDTVMKHKSYADRVKELLNYDPLPPPSQSQARQKLNQQNTAQRNYQFTPSPSVDVRQNKTYSIEQNGNNGISRNFLYEEIKPRKSIPVKKPSQVQYSQTKPSPKVNSIPVKSSPKVQSSPWQELPSRDQYEYIIRQALNGSSYQKPPALPQSCILPRKSQAVSVNSPTRNIPINIETKGWVF